MRACSYRSETIFPAKDMKDLLFSACLLVKNGEIDNTLNIFLYILQFKNICLQFCVLPGLSRCSSALHCAVNLIYIFFFCTHDFHDTAAIGCFFFLFLISVVFSTLMEHCNDAVSGKWQKKESKQKRRRVCTVGHRLSPAVLTVGRMLL